VKREILSALEVVASRLTVHKIRWILVGTTSLFLQDVDVEPEDIDVFASVDDIHRAGDLLKDYEVLPITFGTTELFKSYRGVYNIKGVKVEVMGDLEEKVSEEWISLSDRLYSPVMIQLGSIEVPVSPLRLQLKSYQRLKREKDKLKIDAIKKALQKK
jgi:hypothetical protein